MNIAIDAILDRLSGVRRTHSGWQARCPSHEDRNPSLSIGLADGKILLHCHAACPKELIVAALGLTMADLFLDAKVSAGLPFAPPRQTPAGGQEWALCQQYEYLDLKTGKKAEKGRFEAADPTATDGKNAKQFKWRWSGETGWGGLGGARTADMALWGHELLEGTPPSVPVYFVEGEKAAIACRNQGLMAVTHGGGAGTRDFGLSLNVLLGRKVVLWPDNDAPGRDYMTALAARLRGIAAEVTVLHVALPPKGDAADYFALHGTVEALQTATRRMDGPTVDYLPDEAIRVILPSAAGFVSFTFAEIEQSTRSLDAELAIEMLMPGFAEEPLRQRINLRSSSARTELRRDLENMFTKAPEWTKLLNKAFYELDKAYQGQDRSIALKDIEAGDTELYFHDPLLTKGAINIFFGDGSSGKSYFAFHLAYCVTHGIPFMGASMPQVPVLIVDAEDSKENFRRRLDRVAQSYGAQDASGDDDGLIRYHYSNGMQLRDMLPTIRGIVHEWGIGLVIFDSIGPLCGGKPEDADIALGYTRAIRRLGSDITTLHISHVTKGEATSTQNTKHPFGSVFWHNEARRTWFFYREQEEESDDMDVGVFCMKANDGPKPKPFAVRVNFTPGGGPVSIRRSDIRTVTALQERRSAKAQIRDELAARPRQTAKELSDATGLNVENVRKILRDTSVFTVTEQKANGWANGRPEFLYGLVYQGGGF